MSAFPAITQLTFDDQHLAAVSTVKKGSCKAYYKASPGQILSIGKPQSHHELGNLHR